MNTEKKEHVVTEVYYPLGFKIPYLRRTGNPLERMDYEFVSWLKTCTVEQLESFIAAEATPFGYRALEVGETVQTGDECIPGGKWEKVTSTGFPVHASDIPYHRTTRPKPEPVYRPLEPDEVVQDGDEYELHLRDGVWIKFDAHIGFSLSKVGLLKCKTRTTRPKPDLNLNDPEFPGVKFRLNNHPHKFNYTTNFDPKGEEGKKKPQLALIPPILNTQLANALAFGAYHRKEPYGPWNWRKTKVEYMTYIHAMKRHIDALLEREDVASDSGVHHLGHIAASCAIVLDAAKHGTLVDNRPPGKLNSEPVVDNGAFKGVE